MAEALAQTRTSSASTSSNDTLASRAGSEKINPPSSGPLQTPMIQSQHSTAGIPVGRRIPTALPASPNNPVTLQLPQVLTFSVDRQRPLRRRGCAHSQRTEFSAIPAIGVGAAAPCSATVQLKRPREARPSDQRRRLASAREAEVCCGMVTGRADGLRRHRRRLLIASLHQKSSALDEAGERTGSGRRRGGSGRLFYRVPARYTEAGSETARRDGLALRTRRCRSRIW